MAVKKTYTVSTNGRGLNVRKEPDVSAPVVKILVDGTKVVIGSTADTPKGWKSLKDGGFVMAEYLK